MTYVDFNHVDEKHRAIDGRLVNWARWCVTNHRSFIQPMFRLYRSAEVWDHEKNQQKPQPIDPMDAQRIEKAVSVLPDGHRLAIRWCYIVRCRTVQVCKAIGVSRDGLVGLIAEGRQMLVNRRV